MKTRGTLWIGSRAIVWSMLLAGPCYTWPQWIDIKIPWLNFVRWPGSGYVEYTWIASNPVSYTHLTLPTNREV